MKKNIETNNIARITEDKKSFGKLEKEYIKDGLNVKVYNPETTDDERLKKDTQIKEKLVHIMSGLSY